MAKAQKQIEVLQPLDPDETRLLQQYEDDIRAGAHDVCNGFRKMAQAFHQIRTQKLHRTHGTFALYFQTVFGYGRSHASRIADAGALIEKMSPRMSPRGDILEKLNSEAHFRPLTVLHEFPEIQDKVLELLAKWMEWKQRKEISPREVRGARVFIDPPKGPRQSGEQQEAEFSHKFLHLVETAEAELPQETPQQIRSIFKQLKSSATALSIPRKTGIAWTQTTWTCIQGCTRASEGCDNCYAAKFVATRAADIYPGLAVKKGDAYLFTGKILLLPDRLSDPLLSLTPTRIFVNSMSDLFHQNVPDDFISAIFDVMEAAHWHQFQVLTKRPERMAAFTKARYINRDPCSNIWLGTSTENQECFDERVKHLRQVKARVRWLSCEPLLGPIKFGDASGIDWCVVGGESDGGRRMNKKWATSLRDQCKKAEIPFFFKQWGDGAEAGEREEEVIKGVAILDGNSHQEYPDYAGV